VTELDAQPPALEQHTLLLELHHRINNEFTSAINFISVAAVRTDNTEAKAALSDVVELLHQYADVHRALKVPDRDVVIDAGEYLRTLCRSMSRSKLERAGVRLLLSVEPVCLHAERCWRLGMIVHELVTNAARHAFDGGDGEIAVDLSRAGAFVRCSVSDNGAAPANIKLGRGLRILGDLAESLGGCVNRSFAKGTSFTLVFPFTQNERRASRAGKPLASAAQSISALREGSHHVQS
jgi:two-component sensor histidine kinase